MPRGLASDAFLAASSAYQQIAKSSPDITAAEQAAAAKSDAALTASQKASEAHTAALRKSSDALTRLTDLERLPRR